MGLTITPKFKPSDLRAMLEARFKLIEAALLLRLQRTGEQFVINARTKGDYTDRTGNLRNSIGYVILKDGEQIGGEVKGGTEGGKSADRVLQDAIGKFPRGYVLIVVAGMDYAAAVESKGKDVLTGSSKIATRQLKDAMTQIAKKMGKMK
jgi:hypothetical protein